MDDQQDNSRIWFAEDASSESDAVNTACSCDLCIFKVYKPSTLKLYKDNGLKINHCDKITRNVIIKANEIVDSRMYTISAIPKLQSHVGHFISTIIKPADIHRLPIPHHLIELLQSKFYTKLLKDFEMTNDTILTSFYSKSFPNLLWTHAGLYLITQWNHPE